MANSWQLQGTTATLTLAGWRFALHVDQPEAGVEVQHASTNAAWNIFQVRSSNADAQRQLLECYQRDDDLIATFASPEFPDARAQILYRLHRYDRPDKVGIELVVSMQTQVLHTVPVTLVETDLRTPQEASPLPKPRLDLLSADLRAIAGNEIDRSTQSYFTRITPTIGYLEMLHPVDLATSRLRESTLAAGTSGRRICRELFARPLEKGVILRSRLLGLCYESSLAAASDCQDYLEFAHSQPPINA